MPENPNPTWTPAGMRSNLAWNWDQDYVKVLDILGMLPDLEQSAFTDIADLQDHNPPVYNSYIQCHQAGPGLFWTFVVEASTKPSDLEGCRGNLNWQWQNNKNSIKNAQAAYTGTGAFANAVGMFHLMHGQRHNKNVMDSYRAAYRDNPQGLWDIVNSYV